MTRPVSRLLAATLPLLLLPLAASAQRTDQKAVEAALAAVPAPVDVPIFVSPVMLEPNVQGKVSLNEENLTPLRERFGAVVAPLEEAVGCTEPGNPATCHVREGGVYYQFYMPDPIDEQGRLRLRLLRLAEGEGESGGIGREEWALTLVRREPMGWTVVDRELLRTVDGPW